MNSIKYISIKSKEAAEIIGKYSISSITLDDYDKVRVKDIDNNDIIMLKSEYNTLSQLATEYFNSEKIPCECCDGTGNTEILDCKSPLVSNCCGGCFKTAPCLECNGSGLIYNLY